MLLRKRRPAVICPPMYDGKSFERHHQKSKPGLARVVGAVGLSGSRVSCKMLRPTPRNTRGRLAPLLSIDARHPAEFPRSPVTNQQCSVAESVRSSSHLAGKNALREIRVPLRKQGDRSLVGSWSLVRRRG